MRLTSVVVLLAAIALVASREAPSGWTRGEKPSPNEDVVLTFALRQRNLDKLEEIFWDVSNPKSANYGKYLKLDEIIALVAPPDFAADAIISWAGSVGVDITEERRIKRWASKDFLDITFPASVAESALGIELYYYEHTPSGLRLLRSEKELQLPSDIEALVDFVSGVNEFPRMNRATSNPEPTKITAVQAKALSRDKADFDIWVDPNLLRDQYSIGDAAGSAANNSQSVVQFIGQFYSPDDLEEFFDIFYPSVKGNTPVVIGPDDGSPGLEASLDIEYIMSIGANIKTTFWSNKQPQFIDWIKQVASTPTVPWVFSVSYGENEDSVTREAAERLNVEFMKQGVRGVSILFASGDSGVGGSSFGCKHFVPDFPATSPYITAVGGTRLGLFETGEEEVNSLSGGGFSNYFGRPSYQEEAVATYLTNNSANLPLASKWNATGRGYPDVSALSSGFVIVIDRIPTPGIAGTSCAAPTTSGIIALLNDIQLQNGKPTLGFLNPWIYQTAVEVPGAFFDVVKGSNPGCGTDGFYAAPGWDPASGVGTPNYKNLIAALP